MPNQDRDRFVLNREALSQYRLASIPPSHYNEVEGLRRSLGRMVQLKPSGEVFKVPTCRIMAQAFVRAGDMPTLRQVIMETSNHLDENPHDNPSDILSRLAHTKLKAQAFKSIKEPEDFDSKWLKELPNETSPHPDLK